MTFQFKGRCFPVGFGTTGTPGDLSQGLDVGVSGAALSTILILTGGQSGHTVSLGVGTRGPELCSDSSLFFLAGGIATCSVSWLRWWLLARRGGGAALVKIWALLRPRTDMCILI